MDTATNTAATTPATGTPEAPGTAAPETPAAVPAAAPEAAPEQPAETSATDIESMIQRAVDRATNKLGNENKKLRADLEAERKKNLSASELKQLELQEKEDAIAERERALTDKENRLIAIKAIKEAGLDDGSDASLAIVDFVMAEDEGAIRERVKVFDALIKRIVKAQVDGVFKNSGRTPGVGSDTAANAGGQNNSIAAQLGRNAASTTKAAQSVLDHYTGGKK